MFVVRGSYTALHSRGVLATTEWLIQLLSELRLVLSELPREKSHSKQYSKKDCDIDSIELLDSLRSSKTTPRIEDSSSEKEFYEIP